MSSQQYILPEPSNPIAETTYELPGFMPLPTDDAEPVLVFMVWIVALLLSPPYSVPVELSYSKVLILFTPVAPTRVLAPVAGFTVYRLLELSVAHIIGCNTELELLLLLELVV